MSSPFPGMDPYLEDPAFWPDFHAVFITCWREAIMDALPSHYEARIGERMSVIEVPAETERRFEPDVAVTRHTSPELSPATSSAAATLDPIIVRHVVEAETRETFIEIYRRPERELVTVLELLSPSNKQGSGRTLYLAKRQAILTQNVHLWELDLQLAGPRLPMQTPLPQGDYFAFISRSEMHPDCEVYAWQCSDCLPRLPVPLKSPDEDIQVDLAVVMTDSYERGRYARSLDYARLPNVTLSSRLQSWVREVAAGATEL